MVHNFSLRTQAAEAGRPLSEMLDWSTASFRLGRGFIEKPGLKRKKEWGRERKGDERKKRQMYQLGGLARAVGEGKAPVHPDILKMVEENRTVFIR